MVEDKDGLCEWILDDKLNGGVPLIFEINNEKLRSNVEYAMIKNLLNLVPLDT